MNNQSANVDARNFVTALKTVERVRNEHWIPIIKVAIARFGPTPCVTATDLDQELSVYFDANYSAEFEVAIDPPSVITALGNSSGDAKVTLNDEEGAIISAKNVTATGPAGIEIDDFPKVKEGKPTCEFSIDAGTLHAALHSVRFAMSTEETRYYLNGVFLTSIDSKLAMVATDGHRMARRQTRVQYDGPDIIVPKDTITTLAALLNPRSQNRILITVGTVTPGNGINGKPTYAVKFTDTHWSLTSKCIDGTYPAWDTVMSKTLEKIANPPKISVSLTQSQVSRIPRRTDAQPAILDPDNSLLSLKGRENQTLITMPLIGHGTKFCVNGNYLKQLIGAVGDVELIGSEPDEPLIVKSKNNDTQILQMTMKLPNSERGDTQ